MTRPGLVSFGMYPFPELDQGYDALWAEVARRLDWVPETIDRTTPVAQAWRDPSLVVGQACGWPLVTTLGSSVTLLGGFRLSLGDAVGTHYRSVILARDPLGPDGFVGLRAGVNSLDSLSGWISLLNTAVPGAAHWPGPVMLTGSHALSLEALLDGVVDVASFDEVSLAHLTRRQPDVLRPLVEVGRGPLVPSLPLVTSASTPEERVAELIDALSFASIGRHELLIDGFEATPLGEYEALRSLVPELR